MVQPIAFCTGIFMNKAFVMSLVFVPGYGLQVRMTPGLTPSEFTSLLY